MIDVEDFHESLPGQTVIAHLSFFDETRLELLHETLIADDFEWFVDEIWCIGDQDFIVAEIFVQYVDAKGKEIDSLDVGKRDPCSTLLVFVTCERVAIDVRPECESAHVTTS